MKNLFIAFLFLLIGSNAMADSVVGFIGASGCSGHSPGQVSLYGGKYLDLPAALMKISSYLTVNVAQAGAWSVDRDTGQDGYWTQACKLATMTTISGQSTLDVVVIDIVSECNQGCAMSEIDSMIDNARRVAEIAVFYGAKVIINGFPKSEIYDEIMRERHEQVLSVIPGVTYVNLYDGVQTSDGVHPSTAGMMISAERLKEVLDNLP